MPAAGGALLDDLAASVTETDTGAAILSAVNAIRGTPASTMRPSAQVVAMLRASESLRLQRYRLGDGGWTIGWGRFYPDSGPPPPESITREQAEAWFLEDIEARAARWVRAYVTAPLTQAQFDALVHFAYNVSPRATRTVAAEVNAGRDPAPVMLRYVLPGSHLERGLRNRRAKEIALYRSQGIAPIERA